MDWSIYMAGSKICRGGNVLYGPKHGGQNGTLKVVNGPEVRVTLGMDVSLDIISARAPWGRLEKLINHLG